MLPVEAQATHRNPPWCAEEAIHAHPTLYEALGEAFNAVYGLAINA